MLTTCKSSQQGMNGLGLSGVFSSFGVYLFTRDTPSGLGIVFFIKKPRLGPDIVYESHSIFSSHFFYIISMCCSLVVAFEYAIEMFD